MTIISKDTLHQMLPDESDLLMEYYHAHLPTAKDDEIGHMVAAYIAAEADERRVFAEQLTSYQPGWFGSYASRMAMLSVRQHSRTLLLKAFVARLIRMATSHDDREDMMSLGPLFRSLTLLNTEPTSAPDESDADLVKAAAKLAPNAKIRQFLEDFAASPASKFPVRHWGYTEIDGPAGIIYIWGKRPPPEQWLS